MYPLDLLKSIDIDLMNEKVINRAFQIFKEKLSLLEEIEKGSEH